MSFIRKISLTQFRNYQQASFDFAAPIISITGLNGVGKTNLLDAVYYLCYTKSYFTGYQHQLVKQGCDGFRIEGVFVENDVPQKLTCKWKGGKKELLENDVLCEKITSYVGKHAAVMIAPDDIALINEGSEIRRKWMDGILAQTDRVYFESLLQYQQTLAQRNAWLKMNAAKPQQDFTMVDFYDQLLVQHGQIIFSKRQLFIQEFIPLLQEYYQRLSNGTELANINYQSALQEQPLQQWLKKTLSYDMQLQRTTKGVHRDSLELLLNELPLRQFGSQGQKKSFVFALKLAQFVYHQTKMHNTPVLLLDDIFEKLDKERLQQLWNIVQSFENKQVLITDTDVKRLENRIGNQQNVEHILL